MKQYWKKLGLLYTPEGKIRHQKLNSHAANPLPFHLEGDLYRIFFSCRDINNRSSVGAVDIDIVTRQVIREFFHPLFVHGSKNSFFSHGVSIGNCYEVNDTYYILFMGWKINNGEHWKGTIGRLKLNRDLSIELCDSKPILEINSTDKISLSYPWVYKNSQNSYDMWYGSTYTWDAGNGEMLHVLHHADSHDGHSWKPNGLAVPYRLGIAQAFSHPCIVRSDSLWLMYFSYRPGGPSGTTYRIGYAYSEDKINWTLDLDNVGITVSESGWDSEMIEYPYIFDHKGERYMLYNGNGYGKTGFGLAVLDK